MIAKTGSEQDQRDAAEDDIDEPLRDQAEGAIGAVDERQHLAPVEVLDAAAGQAHRDVVERDADDLADLLAQAGDRLDPVQVVGGQADGDLVDDPVVEDGLDVVHRPEHRPLAGDQRRRRGVERWPMTRIPSSRWRSTRSAKRRASLPVPDHEHVAQVVAAVAQGVQQGRGSTPRDATVSTTWATNSVSRKRRLTSGQLEREQRRERDRARAGSPARPTSWISIRAVHRARSR